jgi:CBS domain-containing protein
MSTAPITIGTKDTLADAVDLMLQHKVKRLPVIRQGRLVGIISRKDILKAYAQEAAGQNSLSDVEISRKLMTEMAVQPWAPREMVNFLVSNGVVEFNGMLTNDRLRSALRVMAEAIPGVRGVKDNMAFVDPVSGVVVDAPIL